MTAKAIALPADTSAPLELELAIPGGAVERVSIWVRDQEPVILPLSPQASMETVVVTPYYLSETMAESKRMLMKCKSGSGRVSLLR